LAGFRLAGPYQQQRYRGFGGNTPRTLGSAGGLSLAEAGDRQAGNRPAFKPNPQHGKGHAHTAAVENRINPSAWFSTAVRKVSA
jgi:hypothetical protein